MDKFALLATIQAKPGKENELAQFLKSALSLAQAEPETNAWFALQLGPSTFGIFDTFAAESGREAYLSGKIAAAVMQKAPKLLAQPARIEKVDILTSKSER